MGPRGYRRSDERIREDVCERLTQHGQIDAGDIDVEVHDGEVALLGTVDSRQARRLAEDTVETVSGVRDIHNQLEVRDRGRPSLGRSYDSRPRERSGAIDRPTPRDGRGGGRFDEIQPGWAIYGADGEKIADVGEVNPAGQYLYARKGLLFPQDLYIPASAVAGIERDRVYLARREGPG